MIGDPASLVDFHVVVGCWSLAPPFGDDGGAGETGSSGDRRNSEGKHSKAEFRPTHRNRLRSFFWEVGEAEVAHDC